MKKTAEMRAIEAERGKTLDRIIIEAIEGGMTWEDLAVDLDITRFTLRDWARKLRLRVITTRTVVRDEPHVSA